MQKPLLAVGVCHEPRGDDPDLNHQKVIQRRFDDRLQGQDLDAGHLEAGEYLLLVSPLEPKTVDKVTELHQI